MKNIATKELTSLEPEHLYSIKELLAFLPISRSCLYKWISEKKIPCMLIKRRKLILGKDILKALNYK